MHVNRFFGLPHSGKIYIRKQPGKGSVSMSDGREEREEQEKRRELEQKENRENWFDRDRSDIWEPERPES
jgi:hypothetical protein